MLPYARAGALFTVCFLLRDVQALQASLMSHDLFLQRRKICCLLPFCDQNMDGSMSPPATTPDDSSSSSSSSLTTMQEMAKLAEEFHTILTTRANDMVMDSAILDFCSPSMSTSSRTSNFSDEDAYELNCIHEVDDLPSDAITHLKSIADRMITAGYGRECAQVYRAARKPAIALSVSHLGIENLSTSGVHMLWWEVLESMIHRWIRAAKACVRVVFASERLLCDQVFESEDHSCNTFFETVKVVAIQMLELPDAVSIGLRRPSQEKLFTILDLHFAISDLLPDIRAIFLSESIIYRRASDILGRFAEAVGRILSEFEDTVLKDESKDLAPTDTGTVHSLTLNVMNYISLMTGYKQTLVELIVASPPSAAAAATTTGEIEFPEPEENQSLFASHLIWIIAMLEANLENMANLYKNEALSHFFMMNNVNYIVHKINESVELRELIGYNYLKILTGKFQQFTTSYERAAWGRIHNCLHVKGLCSTLILRERFKSFNAAFDEVHRIQAAWFIPDVQLRTQLKISILEKLFMAYRTFLGRFGHRIENRRHLVTYIKYSPDDLVTALSDFFEGRPLSRRKSYFHFK